MSAASKFSAVRSGVYRSPDDVSGLRAQAAATGAVWFDLPGGKAGDKSGLMSLFARGLHFPASFGANWDALADDLQDMSWRRASGYVLHVREADGLRRALGAEWGRLLEILETTARYWAKRGKPFVVIMDGAEQLPSWT